MLLRNRVELNLCNLNLYNLFYEITVKKPINLFTILVINQQCFLPTSIKTIFSISCKKVVNELIMVNDNNVANQDSSRGTEN